jgi:PAS domain S-box-containing protein
MPQDSQVLSGLGPELLVQSVTDYAIYMLDPEGVVSSWNAGAELIKGYAPSEVIGRHFSMFYLPDDQAAGLPAVSLETARREGRYAAEGWRMRKDGGRFWASVVIDPIRQDGQLLGFAKITRDMTQNREAQQALLESERRFRLLVEGVTDYAIYMLDPTGIITNWNAGAERIKGYGAHEIIGQHYSRFFSPEDQAAGLPQRGVATAAEVGRYEAEGWRVRRDGSRFWASVVMDAIYENGALIGFAKITRDITERRDAQMRLDETREQLFQAQKMEALGQLTGGLAHDFNNLLTAILAGTNLVLRNTDNSEKVGRFATHVQAAAQRGASLTKQLLAFARRQPLEPAKLDLGSHLSTVGTMLRHSLAAEIELICETSDQTWPVEVDATQLELAILNLGFNARDAMLEGGVLRLSARNRVLTGEGGLEGEFVAISLADTGQGIPAEIRDRVLEPFFTTKAFGHGTGLGLSQAYGFANQSNGALTIESEVGRGTTVTILLPVFHEGGVGRVRSDIGDPNKDQGVVLVVEDDPTIALLAEDLLQELGYRALVVHSGVEAQAVLAKSDAVRLLFSDVVMPGGMSGLELAKDARRRRPELPVLLTTGYSEAIGATSEFLVLSKPYQLDELEAAIRAAAPLLRSTSEAKAGG